METYLVCPVEIRNQLGVLLKIPSLCWLEANKKHTQKDGAKPEMSSEDHESSSTTQKDAQTTPNGYKGGYFMTQPKSQNEETGNNPTSFLEFPTSFSGMYTYQTNVNQTRSQQGVLLEIS